MPIGILVVSARLAGLAIPLVLSALPARALVINAVFDSSITGLPNATTIEHAFDTAAARFEHGLSNPVTVNLDVSWGKVSNTTLPANSVESASLAVLDGYYTHAQVETALTGAATTAHDRTALHNLPASPASELLPGAGRRGEGARTDLRLRQCGLRLYRLLWRDLQLQLQRARRHPLGQLRLRGDGDA